MKKSSKVLSLVLAVLMAMSCFTGLTIFSASAAEDTKIYFQLPSADLVDWGTTKSVYCHLYNVYGDDTLFTPAWQTKSERCKPVEKGSDIYYFDTANLHDIAYNDKGKPVPGELHGGLQDGCDYALIFSTTDSLKQPHQTCNITLSKECLGGTIVCTGGKVENTENSEKLDDEATWSDPALAAEYGPRANITSTGAIIGEFFGKYQPKENLVSQFIFNWAVKNADRITPELVQSICADERINVDPMDVYNDYATTYAEQLADPETYPMCAPLSTVAELLGVDPNTTTEPATTEPATTEAATTEPATTEAATTEAATTEAATTEPATTEAATTEPATTEAATTEPATTEAATTEPATTEPATTEPATTEPSTTQPATDPIPAEPTYVVAGTSELCNNYTWIGDPTKAPENVMSKDGDVYKLVFPAAPAGNHSVKVVENPADGSPAIWHGDSTGNNINLNISAPCDVTVTYNPATQTVDVTGENVKIIKELKIDHITAVGGGDGNWLNGAVWDPADLSNEMTEISDKVYQIRYNDIDGFPNYQLKFAANLSWADSWGGVFNGFDVENDAVYNGKDIVIDTTDYELCDIILTLDLSKFDYVTKEGAKFTVKAIDKTPAPTGIYGDADGDGEITVKDATLIQKMTVQLVEATPEDEVICDVDGDGYISIQDVTVIQKYIVQLGYNTYKVGQPVTAE